MHFTSRTFKLTGAAKTKEERYFIQCRTRSYGQHTKESKPKPHQGHTFTIGNINIQHTDPIEINTDIHLPLKDNKLAKLQESDPHTKQLRKQWENKNLDQNTYMMENNILKRKLVNNRLLYTPIVVPDVLKDCLLILAHDKQGHNGFRRTYVSLKNRYHRKGMKKSVYQHCTNCQVCAKHNIKTQQLNNEHFSSPPQPMEFIAMDLIGEFHPASSKGNRFALTAVCMLTGFTFCIPLKSK